MLYTKTYTFTNGTTAEGGEVNTEITALGVSVNSITNDQVAADAAIAASKTALGTYTAPTAWTLTIESGATDAIFVTKSGWHTRIGDTVFYNFELSGAFTAGSNSDFKLLLPVAGKTSTLQACTGITILNQNSSSLAITMRAAIISGDESYIVFILPDQTRLKGNSPANGDVVCGSGQYKVA